LHFCKTKDIVALKVDSTSTVGLPDLIVVLPDGQVLFVELKTPTGRLSKMQEHILTKLRKNNANAYVCRSLEEFQAIVEARTG
tara:strand:+ start:1092 stop:1340 length:249 start_codon:yes stop_codon:yes gene_type:complete